MSDWQVGDLVVCVDASDQCGHGRFGHRLSEGQTYRVLGVTAPGCWSGGSVDPGLIVSVPNENELGDWHPSRFRKIRPDEHEACEPEFVTLLKRTKVRA